MADKDVVNLDGERKARLKKDIDKEVVNQFSSHSYSAPEVDELQKQLDRESEDVLGEILEYGDSKEAQALRDMNSKHAVIADNGGKASIIQYNYDPITDAKVISFISKDAFKLSYMNKTVKTAEGKVTNLGAWWLAHRQRREYNTVIFDPSKPREWDGCLNLWEGFGTNPKKGSWKLAKKHIWKILCNKNKDKFKYVMRWVAWTLQNPGERAQVAVIFKGKQGAGKGFIFTQLIKIFGRHGMAIADRRQLTGQFNGHLRSVSFLFADEAYYPGDKEVEGVLKQIITEPVITLRAMYSDATAWKNCLHIGMATNNEWVIPASGDSRRFFINKTENTYAKNECSDKLRNEYFEKLWDEMDNGGREAMLYDLLKLDLKGWHPTKDIPETEELHEQIQYSLPKPNKLMLELLDGGVFPGSKTKNTGEIYANAKELSDYFELIHPGNKLPYGVFVPILKAIGCSPKTIGNKRVWVFPELVDAKSAWRRVYGKYDFDDRKEWALSNTSY